MQDLTTEILTSLTLAAVITTTKTAWTAARQTRELWNAHLGPNATNANGAPKWYTPTTLIRSQDRLHEALERLRDQIQHNSTEQSRLHDAIRTLTYEQRTDRQLRTPHHNDRTTEDQPRH